MSQVNPFSAIIRPETEHARPVEGKEALVAINARTGQVVHQPGLLETLTGDFRYFLVSNSNDRDRVIKGTKRVKYKEGQGEITIAIEYEGGCRPGQEWWLAQCFFNSRPTADSVNDSLARWLIEYFSTGTATIDDFYSESAGACGALATKAGQEYGLDLRITLKLEGADGLETINYGPLRISSRLKDSDNEKGMLLSAELEVDPRRIPRALLNQNREFTELLEKGVRSYISARVTLDTFYNDLTAEHIRSELRGHLDTMLRPFGRKVGHISLKADGPGPPKSFKGETVIEYRHHEYPDPIKVNVSVLMTLKSAARHEAKGSPELDAWLDENLKDVVNVTLFGVSYVDLLLNFPQLKKNLDDLMIARADEVGYHIEQLVTILHFESFEPLKHIDIEIKGSDALFETSLSNFHVGLEIFLTARVSDLRGVARYLSTKQDVRQTMRDGIILLVKGFMHGTSPERFCSRYSRIADGTDEDEADSNKLSFEEELRLKIHSMLGAEFNAEVLGLVLKPTQTEWMTKVLEASRRSHDFKTSSELGNLPGALAVTVKGSFKIINVSNWKVVKECDTDAELIRKRIEDSVRARLKVTRDEQLTFSEQTSFDTLVGDALLGAIGLISDEFGLAVKITTAYWDWEEALKQLGRKRDNIEIASVQERIRLLTEELLDAIQYDADPTHIEGIKERIRRLSATLNPALTSGIGIQHSARPEPPKGLPSPELDEVDS
ncbi:MAG: hypothetical protein ACJ74T_08370 [Pyrinomonadaceae bacterium]